jgi:NADPH:quinone reductase-like Zn-dependent oxidoreductase
LVKSLGADDVIDYTKNNPLESGSYDIVYDTVGAYNYDEAKPAIKPNGTYLTLVPVPGIDFFIPGQSNWEPGKGYFVAWFPTATDLQILADWADDKKLQAVIDSVYSLDDIQAAHLRSQTERAVGKIVIRIVE